VSAQRGPASCDAEIGLALQWGNFYIYLPRNLCYRAWTMPDLWSIIPVPRFAATMGHYPKIWNLKEICFWKTIWPKFSIGPQVRAFKEFNLGILNLSGTQFKSLVNWVPLKNTKPRLKPPDPMNHAKVFMLKYSRASRRAPPICFWKLVPDWYKKIPPDHIDQAEINKSRKKIGRKGVTLNDPNTWSGPFLTTRLDFVCTKITCASIYFSPTLTRCFCNSIGNQNFKCNT